MIVSLGIVIGIVAGIKMGQGMSNIYMTLYSLPFMTYVLKPQVIVTAALISMSVAVLGTLYAVRSAARLPPAQAMRPEPPAIYHSTLVEKLGLQHWFSQPSRMILRHIERRPLKSLLTTLGISMACGTMMTGGFQEGAINHMIYTEPTSARSLYSLQSLQGVEHAEAFRYVPVNLRFEHRSYRTAVSGIPPRGELMRLLDANLTIIDVPEHGVILTDYLAELLQIRPGDMLTLEVLEGQRPTVQVPVVGTAKEYLGVSAYMQRS
ncbi:ABC transporter permease, partial [Solemya velum gill symbiont]